jgi:hypothetical protein
MAFLSPLPRLTQRVPEPLFDERRQRHTTAIRLRASKLEKCFVYTDSRTHAAKHIGSMIWVPTLPHEFLLRCSCACKIGLRRPICV